MPLRTLCTLMLSGALAITTSAGNANARLVATAAAPRLEETARMTVPRFAHSATALMDGRVLVAGGFTQESDGAAGAELYDARTERFVVAGRMRTLRQSHTATRLPDGKVLIAGGYAAGNAVTSSAEIYDPASNSFSPTGSLSAARAGHVAVLLPQGKVLLIGGIGPGWSFLSSAELYDPTTGRFVSTGAMAVPRESHAAVRLRDGRVLVIGGHRGRRAEIVIYASAEVYDPATGSFQGAGDMALPRHKHDALLLADGRVLVTAGSDHRDAKGVYTSTELYDPRSAIFTPGAPLQRGRYKHQQTAILLPGGDVLLAGGATQAERYEARTGTFSLVESRVRMAGQFSAAALLPRGGVLITGGYGDDGGPRQTAWVYRP